MNATVVFPDGCARVLPLAEASALMFARGRQDGLVMYLSVPAYEAPGELKRTVAKKRNRLPFIDALTEEQLQGVIADVLTTSYRKAAAKNGVSKFTIRGVMKRMGVSKRALARSVRTGLFPDGAQA